MSEPVLDAGLQAERTRLAWSRTALSVAANGGLIVHGSTVTGSPVLLALGAVVLAFAAVFAVGGRLRYRHVRAAVPAGRSVTDDRLLRLFGVLAVLPGLATLWTVVTG